MNRYYQSAIINTPNMKFTIAVIVLCALQNSLVLGRTPDEVIMEFQPLILELHNVLAKETFNLGNEIGHNYINEYQNAVNNLNHYLNREIIYNQKYIEQKVDEIVAEYNISSHDEQFQHCFAQANTGTVRLGQTGTAGQQVCNQLVGIDINNFKTILNDYKNKQYAGHNAIEDPVHSCKRDSENGSDMVSCLVEHIIVRAAPQVGQILKEIQTDMSGMSSIVAQRLNTAQSCFNFVGEKSEEIMKDVIDEFLKCCVAASQNN